MLHTKLKGASAHNLRGVDLTILPGELVVVTGVSGAGKSSLALDTLYAEGQRRFVESFAPYARQFLERLERPPMESLDPVPAAVAVDRRAPVKSSRSTLATMADLEPYLSALFTREAAPICPEHGPAIELDVTAATERALARAGQRAVFHYPVHVTDAEHYLMLRDSLVRDGFRRLWLEGEVQDIDQVKPSRAVRAGQIGVVVDRVLLRPSERARIASAIESGWQRAPARITLQTEAVAESLVQGLACPQCAREFEAPRAGLFSYESPLGACRECRGFGRTIGVDLAKVVPDPRKTLRGRALRPWAGKSTSWERSELVRLCKRHDVPVDVPWQELSAEHRALVLDGDGSWDDGFFPGVLGWFRWLETRTYKMHVRVLLSRYRSYDPCRSCQGKRLNETALAYHVGGLDIAAWHALEVREARARLAALEVKTGHGEIARRELSSRLGYLDRVGLGYLTLDRQARTLSGGEAQRVTLTAALGTSLESALFVLDEPTVGLHPSDVASLTELLAELARRNNAVLVVEHDPAVIRAADRVVELGPGAGAEGGQIVGDGSALELSQSGGATARALAGRPPQRAPRPARAELVVRSASEHNLRGQDIAVPLGVVTAITGPSGSGKSSFAVDVLYRALARRLGALDVESAGAHDGIEGEELVRRVVLVDQSPLGRTSRGNAATYTKAWDVIRARYAAEPEARARGLTASHFSFNVEGGRCEACAGEGYETVEMQFLADVRLVCPVCQGRRFKESVLSVHHRGLSIADVLESSVDRALTAFRDVPAILRALGPLAHLGLGYLRLGQPLSTLSGGEAQRLKLARALGDDHRDVLYVLDEPSAGLHADEVGHVLSAFDVIVEGGGSVLVVEHDLDVIRNADWVIDLGPGAGTDGGCLVASGTPLELAGMSTRTGRALAELAAPPVPAGPRTAPAPRAEPALAVERAREHNLRDVSVRIPHQQLSVVTGPSGSGKSTLAFDVVFAEGQRRFLETLTPYARQYLPTLPRPDVDAVTGVPPSIALEQRTARAGAKSTVATVTEVAHYLRLLYAKLGVPHCPEHEEPIATSSPGSVFDLVSRQRTAFELCAPVVRARKGLYLDVFNAAARDGIAHAWCDGARVDTDSPPRLARNREHSIDLSLGFYARGRDVPRDVFDRALRWGAGAVKLKHKRSETLLSAKSSCPVCGFSMPELDPRWFSFNTVQGRCETCDGYGVVHEAPRRGRRGKKPESAPSPCPECDGSRLSPIPRAVRLSGRRYADMTALSVAAARDALSKLRFAGQQALVAQPIVGELSRRLEFLVEVGLDYLSLDRPAGTLSGGELQRLRLAAQLGAGLTGALYVLDEPTIGLHPRDTGRLLANLRSLVAIGSTVVVVEHDADTIRAADYLVDLGPGGGSHGGYIVAAGAPAQVLDDPSSPTGRALSAKPKLRVPLPISRSHPELVVRAVSEHNLREVDFAVPHARFCVVAGVSGSGKSTLVRQVLLPAVRQELGLSSDAPGAYRELEGLSGIERAVAVDQSPIGRTPRSVPATFLGIWDAIRKLFAATPQAQVAGFGPSRFSFNTPHGGRCTTCEGQGVITHEMSFLPDVVTRCPACDGKRFEPLTLGVEYLGLSIGDVLALSAEQGAELFRVHPQIASPLATLVDLGAGYVQLGQGSHTLSGGEAQRLKLAAELTPGARHVPTLYVLDEPTTGLHLADVDKLVSVLSRLVERGDTLVVIEHHPQLIAGADWIVELGPEGGARGGRIVARGTPEQVSRRKTATAAVLRELMG